MIPLLLEFGLFKGYVFTNLTKTDELDWTYPGSRCWITLADNTFSVVPGKENWPVVFVTWYGAKAFANLTGGIYRARRSGSMGAGAVDSTCGER